MSSDTHINSIREEYTNAIQDAHKAIDNTVIKFESYVSKLVADHPELVVPETQVTSSVTTPEVSVNKTTLKA